MKRLFLRRRSVCFFFFVLFTCTLQLPFSGLAAPGKPGGVRSKTSSYSSFAFKGEVLAREIATTTGIALNPILCMSFLGAYTYYTADRDSTGVLPWHASPAFWGPIAVVMFLIFLKDSSKIVLPKAIVVPLDALETLLEKNTSALLALPVLVSSVMHGRYEQTRHVAGCVIHFFAPVAFAGGRLDVAVGTGENILATCLAMFGVVTVFVVVWVLSQAFNILILLSPFSSLDLVLSSMRNAVAGAVIWLGTSSFGIILSAGVIACAVVLFPRALRLVIFGTVMSYDIIVYRLFKRPVAPPGLEEGVACFSSCWLADIPPLTHGRIEQADGQIMFCYRPRFVGPKERLATGIVVADSKLTSGIVSPVVILCGQEQRGTQVFRIQAKYYHCPARVAAYLQVVFVREKTMAGRFRQCIRWCGAAFKKTPRLKCGAEIN